MVIGFEELDQGESLLEVILSSVKLSVEGLNMSFDSLHAVDKEFGLCWLHPNIGGHDARLESGEVLFEFFGYLIPEGTSI